MSVSFRKSAVLHERWGGPPGPLGTPPSRSCPRGIRCWQPATSRRAQSIGVKIRPFGQSQAAWRDVLQTLLSAAPRLISALLVKAEEARQECRASRLKPAPRRVAAMRAQKASPRASVLPIRQVCTGGKSKWHRASSQPFDWTGEGVAYTLLVDMSESIRVRAVSESL